ncbi:MAG: Fur family transcriptional regulator [Pseudomonadota bacterium]
MSRIEQLCNNRGMRMTEQRRIIARILAEASDHPDVDAIYQRANVIDPNISIATVYRTVRFFEESGLITRHDFGDGRARYEDSEAGHHDHLIDVETGDVHEFYNEEIEVLKREIAKSLGYELIDHRLELYAKRLKPKS